MIAYPVEQNTSDWLRLRIGKATASRFEHIITPGGEPSKSVDPYIWEILAEVIVGHPIVGPETKYMVRGIEEEDSAVGSFELLHEIETERGGFITNDAGTIGCSPDRLVGKKSLLQIKVPAAHTHVKYLVTRTLDQKYKPQIQGEMYVAERESIFIVSYNPEMPLVVIPVERDEAYIKKMETELEKFVTKLSARRKDLEEKYGPFPSFEPVAEKPSEYVSDFVTDEDVELILKRNRETQDPAKRVGAYLDKIGSVAWAKILRANGITGQLIDADKCDAICKAMDAEVIVQELKRSEK